MKRALPSLLARSTRPRNHLLTGYRRRFLCNTEDIPDFGDYDIILPPDEPRKTPVTRRRVPNDIPWPAYVTTATVPGDPYNGESWSGNGLIKLGSEEENRLRRTAKLAKQVLDFAGMLVQPGRTTNQIDGAVHDFVISQKAYPSPLGYGGFPKSCCTSVNNIIVHGIPDDRPLLEGDIINVDITVFREGYHGDTSRTFQVGQVDAAGRHLIDITNLALATGIAACGPGRPLKDIGNAIHKMVRGIKQPEDLEVLQSPEYDPRAWEYCVSPQFTGHGIGTTFHRPPWILHHLNDEPGFMQPGQCFTIEPNLIQGSDPQGWQFPDKWTVSTTNGARSAQAEHMVLITETGYEVLTQ